MFKEIGTYIRIVDLLLAILLVLDRGVKSILVLAIAIFIISAAVQFMMSYKRLKFKRSCNIYCRGRIKKHRLSLGHGI